jgi:O-antigen/teichoic acid export membrane protein
MTLRARIVSRVRAIFSQRFVGDTVLLQAGQMAAIGAQGVTSLVLLRVLGPDLVGLYALSVAMTAAVGLLDLSRSSRVALVEAARAYGAGQPHRVGDALAGQVRASLQVKGPIVLAFFAVAPLLADAAYGQPDAGVWARWLSLPLLLDIPFEVLGVVLQSRREMGRLVRVESKRAIATSVMSIVALGSGWGLLGLVVARLVASAAASAWAIGAYGGVAARDRTLPNWHELLHRARTTVLRSRLWLGLAMAVEKNVGDFAGQLPVLLVGFLRPDALGYFSAALRTMSLPYPLVSAVARNLDVVLPYRVGQGAHAMRDGFLRATIYTGAIWSVVTAGMAVVAPVLLVRLAGEAYAPAVPALYPLILQSLAVGAGVGVGAALRALDRPQYGVVLQVVSILLSAPVGYALIQRDGAAGGSWFHAVRYVVLTCGGVGWVLWLLRPANHQRTSQER